MKSFRADCVFPVHADPIKNGIVTVDDHGKIISITDDLSTLGKGIPVEELKGIICPGFINTHCHVELSHLKGKTARQKGLIEFIKEVQTLRGAVDDDAITAAAQAADAEMLANGIVAVGDISNSNITRSIKAKSEVYYHTFIEAFGFLPERAHDVFDKALELLNEFKPQSCSVTPHAPYSVSKELFKLIRKYCETGENLISMHNQECDDENKLFRYKLGGFVDLYKHFGMDISYFKPQARNSLQSVIPLLSNKQRMLLVHNTCTNLKDIYFLKRFDCNVSWCFCPGANLYIENKLPKIELFIDHGFNITLGTDSLASNEKLCILNEMKIIQQNFPALTTARLMEWATINGARYLGISGSKGTLEPGKTPGLNLLTGMDGLKLTQDTKVVKLV